VGYVAPRIVVGCFDDHEQAIDDYPRRDVSHAMSQDSDRWEAYMATFQRALPDAASGEKWLPMRRIFALADHQGLATP
jgi:L-rhamnose mutarotase